MKHIGKVVSFNDGALYLEFANPNSMYSFTIKRDIQRIYLYCSVSEAKEAIQNFCNYPPFRYISYLPLIQDVNEHIDSYTFKGNDPSS